MIKAIYMLAISSIIMSCGSTKNTSKNVTDSHTSQNSLDWDGIYRGTLPCADCAGIQTTVYLQKDNTFTIKSRYLGKSDNVSEQKGNFTWNKEGNQITLTPSGGGNNITYQVGENILTQLDRTGNKITGDLASHYILSKSAFAIYERYWKLVKLRGQPVVMDSTFAKEPHLIFKEDNRVTGNDGCNNLSGTFSVDGLNRIKFSQVAATQMACPNMKLEKDFGDVLQTADNYNIVGDMLILNKARMAPLARFKSVVMK